MSSAAIEMAIENDWVNGKFEETETDYKISGTNILYKNEIEFLPKGVELLCNFRLPGESTNSMLLAIKINGFMNIKVTENELNRINK